MKKKNKILLTVFTIIIFINILLLNSNIWIYNNFGNVKFQEILFTFLSPKSGTDTSVIFSYIIRVIVVSFVLSILFIFGVLYLRRKCSSKAFKYLKYMGSLLIVITLILSLLYTNNRYNVTAYFNYQSQKTTIYNKKKKVHKKKNTEYIGDSTIIYQNPKDVKINGDNTNNLIYIYLESFENTFLDTENGGIKNVNCLPELTELAKQNTNFSNTDQLGGALPFTGTTWTIASMTSQFTGLPLKVEVANDMDQQNRFMPGAKTIGDILNENGYIQELMIGSQKEFAGTDKLFLQHGFDKICDINSLKQEYSFKSNELNQWGLDDYKLFELAKNEITQLAQTGKFNFTMATIDCHMPKGFLCKYCPDTYENRYENIYACQSKLINSFIDWCKSQSWYENTTIVLVGDHPTMAQQYVNDVPSDYQRTTYNCFINSKVTTDQIKNRQFTHMDMYPTTLAAMGFNIEGNKLALGTNLFSELPTIIEKYGQDYINEEVQKSSEYLDKNIYQFN